MTRPQTFKALPPLEKHCKYLYAGNNWPYDSSFMVLFAELQWDTQKQIRKSTVYTFKRHAL